MARIKKDCLTIKTTPKKAEQEHLIQDDKLGPKPILFRDWVLFKLKIQKGDELWEYRIFPRGWPCRWSEGLCIVREGKVVNYIETDNVVNYEPENGVFVDSYGQQYIKRWLRKRTTLKKAEQGNLYQIDALGAEPILFGYRHERWLQFKSQIRKGDTLWTFRNSDREWMEFYGREGFCIVRNGEIVAGFVTLQS